MATELLVYKSGKQAARITHLGVTTQFTYEPEYLASLEPPIASTLPKQTEPVLTQGGSVPPFFAGLLPEGRRLTALQKRLKTSADDELSLLAAIGTDTVGDVTVREPNSQESQNPLAPTASSLLSVESDFKELSFDQLLTEQGLLSMSGIAGVQPKASAAMLSLPLKHRGASFILKLNPTENPYLVENEFFFLTLAKQLKLDVATAQLVHDSAGQSGLLVTRFDRTQGQIFPVEDGCQALNRYPADKYNVSFEEVTGRLTNLSTAKPVARLRIAQQLLFSWLTGNGDLHAKNISVLGDRQDRFRIAPAYDLPSTVFYGDHTMALTVQDRDTLTPRRFFKFCEELQLPQQLVDNTVKHLVAGVSAAVSTLASGALPFDRKTLDKAVRTLDRRITEFS